MSVSLYSFEYTVNHGNGSLECRSYVKAQEYDEAVEKFKDSFTVWGEQVPSWWCVVETWLLENRS